MSGFQAPPAAPGPGGSKQISSRLLNMKFMQRAAATTKPGSIPTTPTSGPPLKRRRTGEYPSNFGSPNTPTTGTHSPAYGDRTSISGALQAEKDLGSIRREGRNPFEASENIDTEWVLNVHVPVQTNGISRTTNGTTQNRYDSLENAENDEDYTDEEEEIWSSQHNPSGRQIYGAFKRKAKTSTHIPTSGTTTPTSKLPITGSQPKQITSSSKKRKTLDPDEDIVDLASSSSSPNSSDSESDSSISASASESGEASSSSTNQSSSKLPNNKKRKSSHHHHRNQQQEHDSPSEQLRREQEMDSIDFTQPGMNLGLGRQRAGLSGSGNINNSGGNRQARRARNADKDEKSKKKSAGGGKKVKNRDKNKKRNKKTNVRRAKNKGGGGNGGGIALI